MAIAFITCLLFEWTWNLTRSTWDNILLIASSQELRNPFRCTHTEVLKTAFCQLYVKLFTALVTKYMLQMTTLLNVLCIKAGTNPIVKACLVLRLKDWARGTKQYLNVARAAYKNLNHISWCSFINVYAKEFFAFSVLFFTKFATCVWLRSLQNYYWFIIASLSV